jgi:MoxR-like ATPase
VIWYAVSLVFATRAPKDQGFVDLEPLIAYGASPRATLGLVAAGRALALIRGRTYVLPQDVYDIAPEVLRHRIVLSYEALADGIEADHIVNRVITAIQLPRIAPSQERVPGTRPAGLTGSPGAPGSEAEPGERTA